MIGYDWVLWVLAVHFLMLVYLDPWGVCFRLVRLPGLAVCIRSVYRDEPCGFSGSWMYLPGPQKYVN